MQGSGTSLRDDHGRELKAQGVWCSFRMDEKFPGIIPSSESTEGHEGINARGSRCNLSLSPRHSQA
jgi:hypothetical protein